MVQGLGAALVYAHERNIVHSDFKPGNCFITKEGVLKVLDFGIARAVKNPGAAEGETTIFDPGKLGALTPAYASVEMLEGEEPDTRDDIYALACVAYELLTGKHPFNKIPANKARDSGLSPEPIKSLTRKQWRGLERGLAFARDDRSQSTAEFLEEFEGATHPFRNPYIMVPAVAALILLAGLFPAINYFEEQGIKGRIEMAQSGDPAQIQGMLDQMAADKAANDISQAQEDRILNEAKGPILAYFDKSARDRIDVANGQFDFTGAKLIHSKAKLYNVYTDSSKLQELEEYIEGSENRLLAEQFDKFNAALEGGNLLAVDGEDDIHDVMAIVEKVDPEHAILKDRRIPGAFAVAINTALENEDLDYASDLSGVSLELIDDSAVLINLTDKIAGARDRAETTSAILQAIAAIQEAVDSGDGLAGFFDRQDSIAKLASLDPGNELLGKLRKDIEPGVTRDLAALENSKAWSKSDLMLGDYTPLMRALGLHELNARAGTLREEFTGEVAGLAANITTAVAANDLSPNADQLLQQLASMAPRNERTQDARDQVALAHVHEAQKARVDGDFAASDAAIAAGRDAQPAARVLALLENEDETLQADRELDASDRGTLASLRQEDFDATYPELNAGVSALGADPAAFTAAFDALENVRALSPSDPRLDGLATSMASAAAQASDQLGQAGEWGQAVTLTRAALVNLPQSTQLADKLGSLETERKQAKIEADKQLVADSKQQIEQLLAAPTGDRGWRASIRQKMADISALGEPNDPWLAEIGPQISKAYIEQAVEMRGQQRFAEGANLLADAERYAPDSAALIAEREALATASEAFEREQAEQQRLARIDGLKQTFQSQAKANDVANATKTLGALRDELADVDDPFMTDQAPRLLANAYYKLATQRGAAKDFSAALRFATECSKLQPQSRECRQAVRDYKVGGHSEDLRKVFARGGEFSVVEVLEKISDVQLLDPGEFSRLENRWAQSVASRLEGLKDTAGTAANGMIEQARSVFAGNQLIAAIEPVPLTVEASKYAADVNAAMDKALLSAARDLLKQANREEAQHPDIVRLKGAYNARVNDAKALYDTYKKQYVDKEYDTALATIQDALNVWADSSTFKKEFARVVAKIGELPPAEGTEAEWVAPPPLPPTDPCIGKLAGHGKRKKGTCFYYVAGNQRGPTMVVVPAGEGFDKPFAIGKYEITVRDYNRYCKLSRTCDPVNAQSPRLPITGISLEQARAYVTWLAERTGENYRLPTASEWTYAANAAGDQPKKDFNCRVELGGQLLKGQGTMGVNTGKANGWGLYNYVGNVQEWVQSGEGVAARGGAFEDSFSKCDISLEKPHDGQADTATGFRVLLELG